MTGYIGNQQYPFDRCLYNKAGQPTSNTKVKKNYIYVPNGLNKSGNSEYVPTMFKKANNLIHSRSIIKVRSSFETVIKTTGINTIKIAFSCTCHANKKLAKEECIVQISNVFISKVFFLSLLFTS